MKQVVRNYCYLNLDAPPLLASADSIFVWMLASVQDGMEG